MTELSHDEARKQAQDAWADKASGWNKWAQHMAKMAKTMNQPLLNAAELQPGLRVLDLASGQGQPALPIANIVGDTGHDVATDAVSEMLTGLTQWRDQQDLKNVSIEQADMEDLPFADESFDRVTCRFGIMFTPDPVKALRESRRVLKPGGLACFMVWGEREDVTLFKVLGDVFNRRFDENAMGTGPYTPFRFGAKGVIGKLFADAGFVDPEEIEQRFAPKIDVNVPFWRANLEMRLGDKMNSMTDGEFEALNSEIKAAFEPYRKGDIFELSSLVRIGVGRV